MAVLEVRPPYTQTHLMGVNATHPRAVPLDEYLAETVEILASDEVEVLVERAAVRRDAQRRDDVAVTKRFNDAVNAPS